MFEKLLTVLGGVATVVAAIYAVITYHSPNNGGLSEGRPVVTSSNSGRPSHQIIIQESWKNNSPNIIGNGNVVNSR
jgi:hypothetical protein